MRAHTHMHTHTDTHTPVYYYDSVYKYITYCVCSSTASCVDLIMNPLKWCTCVDRALSYLSMATVPYTLSWTNLSVHSIYIQKALVKVYQHMSRIDVATPSYINKLLTILILCFHAIPTQSSRQSRESTNSLMCWFKISPDRAVDIQTNCLNPCTSDIHTE